MPAHSLYLTSLLRSFSSYLEDQGISRADIELAQAALQAWINQHPDVTSWDVSQLIQSVAQHPNAHIKNSLTMFWTQNVWSQIQVALNEYVLALTIHGCSAATIKNYRSDINQFAEFAGSNQLDQAISKPKIQAFVMAQLDKGLKPTSITRKLVAITQWALWLKEHGWLNLDLGWLTQVTVEDLVGAEVTPAKTRLESGKKIYHRSPVSYLKHYLDSLTHQGASESTIKNYRSDLTQYLDFTEATQLSDLISKAKIRAFIEYQLEKGLKASSINRKLVVLTQFALWATQRGYLRQDIK